MASRSVGTAKKSNYGKTLTLPESIDRIVERLIKSSKVIQGEPGDPGTPGEPGSPGASIEVRNNGTYIQWKYSSDVVWTDLIALSALKGNPGDPGDPGSPGDPGPQGREVELRNSGTYIQWRYSGVTEWTNLIALTEIKGDPGSDAAVTHEFKNPISNGLSFGGVLSIHSPTELEIAPGGALFINNTDSQNPVITHFHWDEPIVFEDSYLTTDSTTYIMISSNGTIIQSPEPPTEIQRRQYVEIGWSDHPDLSTISFAYTEPPYNISVQSQLNDFFEAFKQFNVEGNEYSAASNNLTVKRSAGRTFDNNSNYANEPRNPHIITTDLESPCELFYYYQSAPNVWVNDTAGTFNVDPDHYDTGTGLADVPAGEWTVQLISFYAVYESNDIQYGQATYATYEQALAAIKDPVNINPYNEADTFRAWLIVKQGATNLSLTAQAVFRSAGKFGISDAGSGSIGGSGGEVNTAANIGDYGTGIYKAKSGVTLQFKNVRGMGVLSITDNTTDDTVEFSISEDPTHRFVTDTEKNTWNGKSNLALGDLNTNAYPGDKGKTAYDHSQTAHAPSNAQKNSDITKEEIEAKLTGAITSHSHANSGLTQAQIFNLL